MSRALARILPQIMRNDFLESPLRRWSPFGRTGFDFMDRDFNRLENMMARMPNEMWRNVEPFGRESHNLDYFGAGQNFFKIVGEEGKQKVQVRFQTENCKPEDIEVKTKGNMLEIRTKQEESGKDYSSYHEYTQQLTLPEGVNPEELTCQFDDGMVTLEAPYTAPKLEATKDLPVEHEKVEPVRKEIPIKREKLEQGAQ